MIDYSNKQKFFVVTAGNGSLKEILTLKKPGAHLLFQRVVYSRALTSPSFLLLKLRGRAFFAKHSWSRLCGLPCSESGASIFCSGAARCADGKE
jgi:hypothetical protein